MDNSLLIKTVNKDALRCYILSTYDTLNDFCNSYKCHSYLTIRNDTSFLKVESINKDRYAGYCKHFNVPQYYFYNVWDGHTRRYGNDIVLKRILNNLIYFQGKGHLENLIVRTSDIYKRIENNCEFRKLVTFESQSDMVKYLNKHGKRLYKEVKEEHEAKVL